MRFQSVLVANRGEIACRIIKTVKTMGLKSIAVYSTADAEAPHVNLADNAVCIGDPPVNESYLDGNKIIQAALETGAESIHPGYGFLSENAKFADEVAKNNLIFIGPPGDAISIMGNKAEAKRMMQSASVPCVPGYLGNDQSLDAFVDAAQQIGFPIMVKAAAGGGGRGMRLVESKSDLEDAISLAAGEAENAFGSGELILEKAILRPRHVEFQVFADQHGSYVHLGERDCSIQRRHQKIIEEAPCPIMTADLRKQMGEAAVAAAKSVDYVGAGTVEFLLDEDRNFYFLEMNTRLQVEHPVTELITGLDMVSLQLSIAQGNPIPFAQEDVSITGHAIEVRLYAEDPASDFLPSTGTIELWKPPRGEGIRIDGGIATGQTVSPFYDPMLAKVIAHGATRDVARSRLIKALEAMILFGPKTNGGFLIDALSTDTFGKAAATTDFMAANYSQGVSSDEPEPDVYAIAAALFMRHEQISLCHKSTLGSLELLGWTSGLPLYKPLTLVWEENAVELRVTISGNTYQTQMIEKNTGSPSDCVTLKIEDVSENFARVRVGETLIPIGYLVGPKSDIWINKFGISYRFEAPNSKGKKDSGLAGNAITAPMPGSVVHVPVEQGQKLAAGDTLLVIEAMKMQHPVKVPRDAVVKTVFVKPGDQVRSGDMLIELEEEG